MKKIAFFILALLLLAGFGLVKALQYRNSLRQARQAAKAPQKSVTFIEGWSNKDIGAYLEKQGIVPAVDFQNALKAFDPSAYGNSVPKAAWGSLEGFLFPDTYFIPSASASGVNVSQAIIKKALDNFSEKITPEIISGAKTQGFDLYKLIILSSILEKESRGNLAEKKIIAGIFYNRLAAGMALQSDATVNYATGKSQSQASAQDITIDSPYNTYKYKGLPPGPICNPGLNSILAAAEPAKTDYFYFLTDPATGKAIFAVTYDEQIKNKQKYLK